jgi:hypothetical protein
MNLTLLDLKSRMDPNGAHAEVVETLAKSCPLHIDAVWKEGNLKTGNLTTRRSGLPTIGRRSINHGIPGSRSKTTQVTDTCVLYEGNSEIDVELMKLAKDKKEFRWGEDAAFIEAFNQYFSEDMIYGDTTQDPESFNGLAVRYNTLTGSKGSFGYQVVSAGGSGSDNTSAWFVAWCDKGIHCVYPEGSQAGLEISDKGEQRVTDSDGKPYYAWCTNFTWKPGLAVRDPQFASRVANIDVSDLITFGSGSDTSPKMIQKLILAKNRIKRFENTKPALYVNDLLYAWLEIMLTDKANVYVTKQELTGKMPELFFSGIPIRKCDSILSNESAVS